MCSVLVTYQQESLEQAPESILEGVWIVEDCSRRTDQQWQKPGGWPYMLSRWRGTCSRFRLAERQCLWLDSSIQWTSRYSDNIVTVCIFNRGGGDGVTYARNLLSDSMGKYHSVESSRLSLNDTPAVKTSLQLVQPVPKCVHAYYLTKKMPIVQHLPFPLCNSFTDPPPKIIQHWPPSHLSPPTLRANVLQKQS